MSLGKTSKQIRFEHINKELGNCLIEQKKLMARANSSLGISRNECNRLNDLELIIPELKMQLVKIKEEP